MKLAIRMPNSTQVPTLVSQWEKNLQPPDLIQIVQHAERLGFDMITVPEHFFVPAHQVEHSGTHHLHVFAALGFLAGVTSRIRIMSGASILPLQNAIVSAKGLATVDWLSGGRAHLTHGVGWLEDEFVAMGVPFHERGKICEEYLAAMVELFTNDVATFEGKYIAFKDVSADPKPATKPYPPIWIAGDSDPVLRRIARWADGWNPWQTTPEELPAKLDFIRSQPDYGGRLKEVYLAPSLLALGKAHMPREDERSKGTRDAQHLIDLLSSLWEAGATMSQAPPPPLADRQAYLDFLQWVAEDVRPALPN